MKNIILSMILILALFGCATSEPPVTLKTVAPLDISQRKTLAVVTFENKDALKLYDGVENSLTDLAINGFFETQRFLLVERGKMSAVMEELKLAASGVISSENALSLGKQAGAQYIFIGTISAIKPIADKKSAGIAWIETKGFEVVVQGRIIEVERGLVVASATAAGTEKQTMKVAMGAKSGSIAPQETLITTAFQKAISILTNDLASQL